MRLKKQDKLEMSKTLQKAMTKPWPLEALMALSKKEFLNLWSLYLAHCEAENQMGDPTP